MQFERLRFDLQEFDIRFKGMTAHMRELKQDLNFMLVSFQLRKVNYLENMESQSQSQSQTKEKSKSSDIEDQISRTINKLLNGIDDIESFFQDKFRENAEGYDKFVIPSRQSDDNSNKMKCKDGGVTV